MTIHFVDLQLASQQPLELIDITAQVQDALESYPIKAGLVTVSSLHTTAAIVINEHEKALCQDVYAYLTRIAPPDYPYGHNQAPVDDRLNAHAHLLAMFTNPYASLMVRDGRLQLGQWQRIFFLELDGPRPARQCTVQIMGED